MKITLWQISSYLMLFYPLVTLAIPATGPVVVNNKDLSDLSDLSDISDIELSPINAYILAAEDSKRPKRAGSGSFNILGSLQKHIANTISQASASIAGGSSSSSAGSSSSGSSGSPHQAVDTSHFDGWALKKSILNTIFQAVKAITGGITAINGQLIKGSGYFISAGGKLVSASGDAVSNVGKKIALSAKLIEPSATKSHFVKLASASSGSSSSSSSSSSPSSGHSATGHEISAHGESFTSYETPAQQTHYGPPAHSPSPPISSEPTGPIHVDFSGPQNYLPSSGHDQSYQAPISSYGTPYHGEPGNNYVPPKVEENKNPLYPPLTGLINQKSQALNNAADALRQILNKLPYDKPAASTEHHSSNEQQTGHIQHINQKPTLKKPLKQYEIPLDPPPPPFKPLATPPINSITHTHIITTAYGAPISDYQKPITLLDTDNSNNKWTEQIPIGPGVDTTNNNNDPLNMYHVMSLKNVGTKSSPVSLSSVPPSGSYLPSESLPHEPLLSQQLSLPQEYQSQQYNSYQNKPQQQQHQHQPQPPGHEFTMNIALPGYEIHKSIGFELAGSPSQFIEKRIEAPANHLQSTNVKLISPQYLRAQSPSLSSPTKQQQQIIHFPPKKLKPGQRRVITIRRPMIKPVHN